MSAKPKAKPDLEVRTVDDETVILDRDGEHIHQLNTTASFVWDRCDGSSTVAEIAAELAEAFGVDSELTSKDVEEVVLQFSQLGLLDNPDAGVGAPSEDVPSKG